MAVTSGFFNSLYGDRKYTAEQFSAIFDGVINDGVFSNIGTAFRVSATTDNNITIGIGRAWFNGIWVNNDALLPMTCNDPEVLLDRIDAVVIEINRSEAVRAGRIIFVKGTASGTPVNPTLTHDESVDQYPLAYIRRKAGVSAVVQADITNCIGTSACPYVTGILETQNIDNVVAQWESMFNIWFDGLQVELEGDVAANLASQVIDLNMRFDELAETRTVTVELQDSSLDTIEDSTGSAILGSTVLGESSISDIVVTPSDSEESFKVGDMLTTARTGLGLNWLLCNGAKVDRSSYPDLSPLLPETPLGPWSDLVGIEVDTTDRGMNNQMTKVIYADGYYVTAGRYYKSNNNQYYGFVAYATDLNGPWTTVNVWNFGNGAKGFINDIMYHDGYFIIVGAYQNGSGSSVYARVSYTNNIVEGEWTHKNLWDSGGANYQASAYRIRYVNGYLVVCGYMRETPYIAYASDITASWTQKNLYSYDESKAFDIVYDGEYYCVICSRYSSGYYNAYIVRRTELSSTDWGSGGTNGSIPGYHNYSNFSYFVDVPKVEYVNGAYVSMFGDRPSNSSGHATSNVAGLSLFLLNSTGLVSIAENDPSAVNNSPSDFGIYDGEYVLIIKKKINTAGCRLVIATSKDLTGPWNKKELDIEVSIDARVSISYVNGIYVISGSLTELMSDESPFFAVISTDMKKMLLPEIAFSDNAYTYIKAGGD